MKAPSAAPERPVAPSRDLSAASRAFGEFADEESESAPTSAAASVATKSAAVKSEAAAKNAAPAVKIKDEPPAKETISRPPRSNKPLTLAEAAAAKAGAATGKPRHESAIAAATAATAATATVEPRRAERFDARSTLATQCRGTDSRFDILAAGVLLCIGMVWAHGGKFFEPPLALAAAKSGTRGDAESVGRRSKLPA